MTNPLILGYRGAAGKNGATIVAEPPSKVYGDGDTVMLSDRNEIYVDMAGAVSVASSGIARGSIATIIHTGAANPEWPSNVILPDGYVFTSGERRIYELKAISNQEIILSMISPQRFSSSVIAKTGTAIELKNGVTNFYTGSEAATAFTLGTTQEIGGRAIISSTAASALVITGATAANDYASQFDAGNQNYVIVERLSASLVIYRV